MKKVVGVILLLAGLVFFGIFEYGFITAANEGVQKGEGSLILLMIPCMVCFVGGFSLLSRKAKVEQLPSQEKRDAVRKLQLKKMPESVDQ